MEDRTRKTRCWDAYKVIENYDMPNTYKKEQKLSPTSLTSFDLAEKVKIVSMVNYSEKQEMKTLAS